MSEPNLLSQIESSLKEVSLKYDEITKFFDELEELWSTYVSKGKEFLDACEALKFRILELLAENNGIMSFCDEKIEELNVKMEIGIIDSETYAKKSELFSSTKNKCSEISKELNRILADISSKIAKMKERIEKRPHITDIDELKERAEKLKESYDRGEISEEDYEELKKRITQLVEILSIMA